MNRWAYRAALCAILAAGAAWRLHGLELEGLYVDELHSMQLAWQDWPAAARAIKHHPPLFYLLLKAWRAAAGDSLFALRLLPALLGSLCVLAVAALARELWDRPTALFAAALLASSDLQRFFAREIKGHALLVLLALLSAWLFVRYLERRGALTLLGSTLCGLGAAYTHYSGLLLPAGLALFVALRRPPGSHRWWTAQLVYLGYLPWAGMLLADLRSFPRQSSAPFGLADLAWLGHDLLPGGLLWAPSIALLIAPLVVVLRRARRDPRLQLPVALLLATGILPLASSLCGFKMVEFVRHLLPAHALLLLLFARGALQLERPALRRGLVLGLLACHASGIAATALSPPQRSDWTAVSRFLESRRDADAVLVTDWHFLHDHLLLLYGGPAPLARLDALPAHWTMRRRQEAWASPAHHADPTRLLAHYRAQRASLPRGVLYVVVPDEPGHRAIQRTMLSLLVRDARPGSARVVLGTACGGRFAAPMHYCAAIFVVRLVR